MGGFPRGVVMPLSSSAAGHRVGMPAGRGGAGGRHGGDSLDLRHPGLAGGGQGGSVVSTSPFVGDEVRLASRSALLLLARFCSPFGHRGWCLGRGESSAFTDDDDARGRRLLLGGVVMAASVPPHHER